MSQQDQSATVLKQQDPELFHWMEKEALRQIQGLEMIASENYTSKAVRAAQGSLLTNKYAEGYPGRRYYGGCQYVDRCEELAIERLKKLFQAPFANVQPHSGSQANMAVFLAELKPGAKIMGLDLSHGGHLTHGAKVNFSGFLFESVFYSLHPETDRLDFNIIEDRAKKEKPDMIIAGYSAYPREIDFKAFREIADKTGACLLVDMAHIAGLVAGGAHPSPVPFADYVSSTTHKTLRGPRGGVILCREEARAKKINTKIFPGIQGGPLQHVIAGKAVAFGEALRDSFKDYAKAVVENAKVLEGVFRKEGLKMLTGGTDNHLLLLDLSDRGLTGKQVETALDRAGITVNKNTVPREKRSPFVTSGIRIGTPALTTRGMRAGEMRQIGQWIKRVIQDPENESLLKKIRGEVRELCSCFPLYQDSDGISSKKKGGDGPPSSSDSFRKAEQYKKKGGGKPALKPFGASSLKTKPSPSASKKKSAAPARQSQSAGLVSQKKGLPSCNELDEASSGGVSQKKRLPLWPSEVSIYTDGASRGNPGPCAFGLEVFDSKRVSIHREGRFLEKSNTNNFAEYHAVLRALELGAGRGVQDMHIFSDSELIVRQLKGEYKVKSVSLKPLFEACLWQKRKIPKVCFRHIPREQNTGADFLANQALNESGF